MGIIEEHPSGPETAFLVDLFIAFKWHLYSGYCILRNYAGLPITLQGSDLDILVPKEELEQATKLVAISARKNQGFAVWREWNDCVRVILCSGVDSSGSRWGVHIDLFSALRWKGLDYYPTDQVLSSARDKDGVRVADICDDTMVSFLGKLLITGKCPQSDFSDAVTACKQYSTRISERSKVTFGNGTKRLMHTLHSAEYGKLASLARTLRRSLMIKMLIGSPHRMLRNKVNRLFAHLDRLRNRPGMFVAVIGPDGSGKSTLIEQVRPQIEHLLHVETELHHSRPSLLPALATLLGQGNKGVVPAFNPPYTKPPSGLLLSLVRLSYYAIDYVFGYCLKVYPKLVRSTQVVLFDRYFYDYFFDPMRYRVRLPYWIVSAFEFLVPQPDLVILLKVQPEIAFKRKQELSQSELRTQIEMMGYLERKLRCTRWIDTSQPIEDCGREMLDTIVERFKEQQGWK